MTKPPRVVVALGCAAALATALAVAVAGAAGLLVVVSVLAAVATTIAVLAVPAPPTRRRRPRTGPPVEHADFPSYRQVAEAMSWAAVSPRHYDLVTRPLLQRLLASRLADRHGIDLAADPEQARTLVGADAWPWLDPARPVSRDGQPPGPGRATLELVVGRLEAL